MDLITESDKDETSAVRRVRIRHDAKSLTKERMSWINYFDFVGCLERHLGLAQTCSIKLCALLSECRFLLMP